MVRIALFSVAAVFGLNTAAHAGNECPPLTIVGRVPMQIGADGRIYVDATVNGTPVSMLVDTGGFFTELSQAVATALNLSTFHTGFRLVGLAGDTTNVATRAAFTLGTMWADRMGFMVMTSAHRLAPDVRAAGGILAPNLFRNYDLDLDMAGRRLQLISPEHCEGKVVYWKSTALAEVPVRITAAGHVLVPIALDGQNLTALLDTGATVSLLNLSVAQSQFNLSASERGASRPGMRPRIPSHTFQSLSFAGVVVSNPQLVMVPDVIRRKMAYAPAGPDSHMPDVILGMDILRHLHLYVAYKEKKVYITPALPTASISAPAPHPSSLSAAPPR